MKSFSVGDNVNMTHLINIQNILNTNKPYKIDKISFWQFRKIICKGYIMK